MAKGVADARHGKGLSIGEANENERRGMGENSYRHMNEKPFNNYDWSRRALNFEIVKGQIVPLGSQEESMYFRYLDALKKVDFKQYKDGATNQQNTYAGLIFSGSTEHMQRIAFGDQEVDYTRNPEEWKNWNVKRLPAIEEWAMDTYKFACSMYGEENIIGFDVHLDETAPHIHCKVVPTAVMQQRGRGGGYHKVDADGNPVTYTKGKHIGEVIKISEKKYEALSEEKKKEYRPNVRGTVRTISYGTYFGKNLKEREEKLSDLHTQYYNHVGIKWGLKRGDVIAELPEEEQRRRKHMNKEEAHHLDELRKRLRKQEEEAEEKMASRQSMLEEIEQQIKELETQLYNIGGHYAELEKKSDALKRTIVNNLEPEAEPSILRDMQSIGFENFQKVSRTFMDGIREQAAKLGGEAQNLIGNILHDSGMEEMTEHAAEISAVAAALFLGYIDQATNYAVSHGGGGGPGGGWGRDPNDDDDTWKRKCFGMAALMMRPAQSQRQSQWRRRPG